MQTVAQKLEAVESSLRRWHSRLTRASNAIRKLEQKRRRLLVPKPGEPRPVKLIEPPAEVKAIAPPEPQVSDVTDISWSEMTGGDLTVPAFLARPAVEVDTMTITRKMIEAEDRKKMPLTGKEALAAIRAASAKVTAKRTKKELRS